MTRFSATAGCVLGVLCFVPAQFHAAASTTAAHNSVCEAAALSGPARQDTAPVPLITLRRTRCNGMCPVYRVSIFADGTVEWQGEMFVRTLGKDGARLSSAQVEELRRAFLDAGFFGFQDSYKYKDSPDGTRQYVFDLSTTFVTFSHEGRTRTIEDYHFGPEALTRLELLVDRVANTHKWKHDGEKALSLDDPEPSYRFTVAEDLKNTMIVIDDAYSRGKPGFTTLMQAAGATGDASALKKQIGASGDVNAKDETGWTALMIASATVRPDAVTLLLENGAQVDATDQNGDTALIGAAANTSGEGAQTRTLQILIGAGARADQANRNGETALMWAARSGNYDAVEALLAAGADPKKRDNKGHDALYYVQQWLTTRTDDTRRGRFARVLSLLQWIVDNGRSRYPELPTVPGWRNWQTQGT